MMMQLKLFNTATKQKEDFTKDGIVTMYTCGLTVYANPHIGNWRTFIFYDTLSRVLKLNGFDVHDVQNITDVGHLVSDEDEGEDKLAKQAAQQKRTAWEVAEEYTNVLLKGMRELNIATPYKMPKATDHIQQQIAMIQELEDKGYTYTIDDGVYFDTSKFDTYGKTLLGKNAKADTAFARIGENDQKRNPEDFALWKFSPKDQNRDMEWESPWGVGFPGWHIECSAMARAYLGKTIDIHAGGIDHIPVHHTNEIAQSEAANEVQFARFWLHGEFMLVDGRKMSKSLGNVFTLDDICKKGFEPLDYRMLVVQGHYRTETNFSWQNIESAHARRMNLLTAAELRWQSNDNLDQDLVSLNNAKEELMNRLNDDLHTPAALEVVSSVTNEAVEKGLPRHQAADYVTFLQTVDKALGLNLLIDSPDITNEEKALITKRDQAKQAKNFEVADAVRDELLSSGIELLDTPAGTRWHRKR